MRALPPIAYAYCSRDSVRFQRFQEQTPSGPSHDLRQWPWNENFYRSGRAVALCDRPDLVDQPSQGTCMAFYWHEPTLSTPAAARARRPNWG